MKTQGLTKKFDQRLAVNNVSLKIQEGEIFGLLGPNGAGKSTTMNMICSLLKPTAGSVCIFDQDMIKKSKQIKSMIGYIPQELAIYGNLKAWENVELFTALYGVKGEKLESAVLNQVVRCCIKNDGKSGVGYQEGMGIAGMRKRVCSVHGYFDIEAEMGFAIHMVLPLKFVDARIHPNDNFRGNKYTKRELEIVEAVAEGLSNKEIAARLYISEGTVKNHISTILDKEGLVHRTQLAVYYLTGRK